MKLMLTRNMNIPVRLETVYKIAISQRKPTVFLPKPKQQESGNKEEVKKQKENFIELLSYLKNAKLNKEKLKHRAQTSNTFDKRENGTFE